MRELRAYKDMEPTYGELAKALEKLGFQNRNTEQYFFFVNDKYKAEILLPLKSGNAKVNKAHFAAFSWGLEQQGVLRHEYDLGKMIEQSRLMEKEPAL